jgi:hypothetical protein
MDAKTAVISAILDLHKQEVSAGTVVGDVLDSLAVVELALEVSDRIGSNTLFERHDFFVAQTVQDLIDVTDKDLRGEE